MGSADTDGSEATGDGDGDGDSGGDGDLFPCDADRPCPDGQFCFNGLCAIGCLADGDCADNQYCATQTDNLCHNKSVPTCDSDADCIGDQICHSGLCSTPPEDSQCDPQGVVSGNDGCPSNAVCLDDLESEDESYACYTFPACAEDDTCPVGTHGAVCNVDLLPGKDRICLVGHCTAQGHCPGGWSCAIPQAQVIGACTSGVFGSPCTQNEQCMSGTCNIFVPGQLGFCN